MTASNHPLSILIGDDDPMVRNIVKSVLSISGHQVEEASSGKLLLEALTTRVESQNFPHLIFLDLQLLDSTAAELLPKIREILKGAPVPVILLSANSQDETQMMFPDLNTEGYLEKPFTPQKLLELVLELAPDKEIY